MVLATQNPIEQEGTYPLPEAQLDRFLFKIRIDYPSEEEEVALTRQVTRAKTGGDLDVEAVATLIQPATVVGLQQWTAHVVVDERVVAYAVAIVRASRETPGLASGAGPRGPIALVRAARARALMAGRGFATPDDIKAVALPALRHRVTPAAEAEIEGLSADDLLRALLERVPAPRA
jgi:MoxR-like ATPase